MNASASMYIQEASASRGRRQKAPAATTWAAEFLIRVGKIREFLGLWMNSGAIHESRRRRATQVITCSFPCGKWLHMIGARASPRWCKAQKKTVIGSHNRCLEYILCTITKHGKAKRSEFIWEDRDRQLESLWKERSIGDVLPWEDITDEAERLLAISNGGRNAAKEGHDDEELENDQEVERDGTDPYNEVIFGRMRPDSVVIDWANKVILYTCMCWNSSVRRINDEITERGGNFEQWLNTTSSSKASKN